MAVAIIEKFLNLLFPKYCLGCKKEGVWICDECAATLVYVKITLCPWCSKVPTVCGFVCQECKAKTHLSQIIWAYDYNLLLVEKMVLSLKYAYVEEIAEFMGNALARQFSAETRKDTDYIVIPIPLHKKRMRERGFNQAERIGRAFAKQLGILSAPHVLARVKHTKSQVGLSKEERSKNVSEAFRVRDASALVGKSIILIDDVYTTGATMREAASALIAAGAKKVIGVAFAKG